MKGILFRLISLGLAVMLAVSIGIAPASAALWNTGYRDVEPGDWYAGAVEYVSENGLMNGMEEGVFAPNTGLNRGMFITILGRISGVDKSYPTAAAGAFSDVDPEAWYAPYVAWAVENGVTRGMGDGRFGTAASITRQDMATMIARWLETFGLELPAIPNPVSGYRDVELVSSYALEGLEVMRVSGVIQGDANGNFNPLSYATRAEAATVMMRLDLALSGEDISPEPSPEPAPQPPEPEPVGGEVTVGERVYAIGDPAAELPAPEEIADSFCGVTWWFYGIEDYTEFVALGVEEDRICAIVAAGMGFSYQGMSYGDLPGDYEAERVWVRIAVGELDGGIVHAVALTEERLDCYYYAAENYTLSALEGECRMNFHLTNAFRVAQGLAPFLWCEKAEQSALLHSQDMAKYDYFSHAGRDGSSATDRMNEQGIQRNGSAENIGHGHRDGFALYVRMLNSSGHRGNLLNTYTHMGVGGGYNPEPGQKTWFTQNMYRSTEQPGAEEPGSAVPVGGEITVGGTVYALGDRISDYGRPDETAAGSHGGQWYFYGTEDYAGFVALGVEEGKIVTIAAGGGGFVYQGYSCGDKAGEIPYENCTVELALDPGAGGAVHGVYLSDADHSGGQVYDEDALAGECRLNYHLTNAFRVCHGLSPLVWCDKAAEAARLHSQDMADYGYFSHTGRDGSMVSQRLTARQIRWNGCAENISKGCQNGFGVYNSWVNSEGHRKNMLLRSVTHLGVGNSIDESGQIYYTQNFYLAR